MNKIFILDTNVILFDSNSIYNFEDNDIIIPIIVLEELDRFKKGNDPINLSARSFIRALNELTQGNNIKEYYSLGENRGKLKIQIDGFSTTYDSPIFNDMSTDNKLLALCLNITNTYKKKKPVILVTKDINLRIKAKALGLQSEDYETDKISNLSEIYKGYRIINNIDSEVIDNLYSSPNGIPIDDFIEDPTPNEFFILSNGESQSALGYYNPTTRLLEKVIENKVSNISPRNVEQIFAVSALLNRDIPLVTLTGTSGSGKTLLALASAIEQKRFFTQILISRSPVPVGKDIGYLPGDWKEKLEPYMQSIWDNFNVIKKESKTKNLEILKDEEKIKVEPLPYLRSRSLPRIFYIIDEAQNLMPHEVKTIITRAGEDTKLVFTGDIHQIDAPYLDAGSNGLTYLISKMKGQPLYSHVDLRKGERSPLAELASNIL